MQWAPTSSGTSSARDLWLGGTLRAILGSGTARAEGTVPRECPCFSRACPRWETPHHQYTVPGSAGGVPPAMTLCLWGRVLLGWFLSPVGPRRILADTRHRPACNGPGATRGVPSQGVVPPTPESACSPWWRAGFPQSLDATKHHLKSKTKLSSPCECSERYSLFLIKSSCLLLGRDKCFVGRSPVFWTESPEQRVLINSRHTGTVRQGGDGSLL